MRAGLEHHSHGVQERAERHQHRAGLRAHRPPELRLRDDHRPGQRPGRTRARPEVRSAARRARPRQSRAPRLRRRRLGHRPGRRSRSPASMPTRSSARSTAARSRDCLSLCFNPVVSLPDNNFVRQALEKLEFYVAIDFFLSETARYAARRPARLAAGRGRRHRHADRRPRHQDQQGRRVPGRGAAGLAHHPGHREGARPGAGAHIRRARARSSRSCAWPPRAGSRTTPASPTSGSSEHFGVFWPCPSELPEGVPAPGPQGTVRLFEPGSWNPVAQGAGPFYFPDGKARCNVTPYVGPAEDVDERVSDHPHHRTRRQPVPLRQSNAAHRAARRSLSRAAHRDAPAAGGAAWHRRR